MIKAQRGFSLPELMIVLGIMTILLAMAIPSIQATIQSFRLLGDVRGIAALQAQARMRAGSSFSRAEVNFDQAASTYQVEVWCKSASAYVPEGGAHSLSQGDVYGYAPLTTPAGGQTTIGQTTQIIFNSRGQCVDGTGNVTGNDAIYITNNQGAYLAVTVSPTGRTLVWKYVGNTWVAF